MSHRSRRCHEFAQFLALVAALVSWQPLLGYAYQFKFLYGITAHTQIALHAVVTFIILCVGVLLTYPQQGVMKVVTNDSLGGFIARRLLVAALVIPSVVGYLVLQGYRAKLYSTSFGLSLLVMVTIVVFAVWILQIAQTLDRIDRDRSSTKQSLHESQERFRALANSTIEGILIHEAGKVLDANLAFARMFGYELREVMKLSASDFLTPESYAIALEKIQLGDEKPYELTGLRKDGTTFSLEVEGKNSLYQSRQVRVSALRDITERKRAEATLQESEKRLRRLVESNIFGVAFGDLVGKINYVNDYFLQMTGYTREELLSGEVHWTQMTPPEFLHLDMQAAEELRTVGIATPFEKEYIRKDGTRVPILIGGAMLQEPYEEQQELIAFYLDLSESKRNQALLAAQTHVLELIATGVALSDVLDVLARSIEEQSDDALCTILLLNPDGTMLGECIAPSIPESYKEITNQGVAVGACSGSCGTAVYRRQPVIVSDIANDPLWAEWRDLPLSHGLQACWSVPIFGKDEEVLGTFAMYYRTPKEPSPQDRKWVEVSTHLAGIAIARQRAESALRESEERFRTFFEEAPIGISVVDLSGRFLTVNKTYCEMLGYSAPELHQLTFAAITHPNDVQTDVVYAEQLFKGEIPSYQLEKRYIKKNGESLWVNLTSTMVSDQDGKISYGLGMVEDITERKQAEEALSETNQTLQALIQACPLAITVFSLDDGRVKMWNPAAEEILGWSEQEAIGHFLPSVSEDKQAEFLANLDFIRQGNTLTGIEARRQKKGGSEIDISVWAAPLCDAKGNVSCMSIVADISDRKRTEAALKESEERFRKLTEKVRVIPWEADATTGRFTYVGPQSLQILGYPLSDWYTDNFWSEHIYPEDRDWTIQYCLDRSATLENYEFEYRMSAADGRVVWLYDIVNVVRSEDKPSVLRGFMIDITERKRVEAEREQLLASEQAARSEAESANRMKDEFLATLSHELRTPLNAMLGWTQLLRTRKFNEATAARALETIDRNTKSLAALIEDVLDVSRIIRGKLHLNTRPVELVCVIEAAIDTVRPAAQAKDIRIESRLDSSIAPILGDGNRLQQVVWNLLSNAIKFTPKGGRVEVQLSIVSGQLAWTTDKYVQIQVSDTGKGIAPEFLPHVFDRFRQENSSTTRAYGGLGLGLAIVRHLVELHGGTVRADSLGEGQGATFSVQLPLVSSLTEGSNPLPLDLPVEDSVPFDNLPDLTGLRVLVVDDEADARELLASILAQYGVEVTTVATAGEVLEALPRLKPSVLVSDIGMPGEDGYALIQKIRALDAEQGGQIPAVALTAYARTEDRIRALASGFQLHMPKPVNPEELVAVVANLAGRKR
ncbi:MAG: PAS domain S-box protein [Microcoleus sp. SIO2G3]|nr:PAS domain S-box protein [Microcoleus sp. SIO2G3]